MLPYNTELSHAFTALNTASNGELRDRSIIKAYDVSGYVEKDISRFKPKILICTDTEVIFI